LIQAARRLYNPTGKKLPLPMVVELNRRLVKGYAQYKDDPRMANLKKSVLDYNQQLRLLGLRDHQVEYAKFSVAKVVFTLLYRLGKLTIMSVGTLPGLVLFAPVFVATKVISIKKSREALAASTVKVQARDVLATWKLLVALGFAPILYAFYTFLITWATYRNRVWGYVPERVPLWGVVISGMIFFPSITFAALRFGEIGMDIFKSLRPLVLSLNPTSANTLVRLKDKRSQLSVEVTELINTLGPEMFPDFDHTRIVADPFKNDSPTTSSFAIASPKIYRQDSQGVQEGGTPTQDGSAEGHLSRSESFGNLGNIGLFATRPPSRSRSRSSSSGGLTGSGGFPLKGFSTLNSKEGFDEVTKKIRGAMAERGKERSRKRAEAEGGWEVAGSGESGAATPGSEEGKKYI
jgi:glycerol-3-phosphate O-acyltransferase/dihydroxyacetone phosphate acyltransferase